MPKLKLQYFGYLMWRVDSLEKTLMMGGIGGRREGDDRGWDGWMASLTQWMWVWVNSGSWWWTARPGVLRFMGLQRVGHDWATELNSTGAEWSRDLFHLLRGEWWSLSFARIHRIGRWVDFPLTLPELDVNASSTTHWLSILNSFLSFSKFQFSHL